MHKRKINHEPLNTYTKVNYHKIECCFYSLISLEVLVHHEGLCRLSGLPSVPLRKEALRHVDRQSRGWPEIAESRHWKWFLVKMNVKLFNPPVVLPSFFLPSFNDSRTTGGLNNNLWIVVFQTFSKVLASLEDVKLLLNGCPLSFSKTCSKKS